jgi:actin-related protein
MENYLIVDIGSHKCRAGFSHNHEHPNIIQKSEIALPALPIINDLIQSDEKSSSFSNKQIFDFKSSRATVNLIHNSDKDTRRKLLWSTTPELKFHSPIQPDGTVTNWDHFELLLKSLDRFAISWSRQNYHDDNTIIYRSGLFEAHPVILSQKPLLHRSQTEKKLEILFETMKVSSAVIALDAALACYSAGRLNALEANR